MGIGFYFTFQLRPKLTLVLLRWSGWLGNKNGLTDIGAVGSQPMAAAMLRPMLVDDMLIVPNDQDGPKCVFLSDWIKKYRVASSGRITPQRTAERTSAQAASHPLYLYPQNGRGRNLITSSCFGVRDGGAGPQKPARHLGRWDAMGDAVFEPWVRPLRRNSMVVGGPCGERGSGATSRMMRGDQTGQRGW